MNDFSKTHWTTGQPQLTYLNEIILPKSMNNNTLLTTEEFIHFIDCIPKEHKLLISFVYSTSISLNQLINIRWKDLPSLEEDLPESLIINLNTLSKKQEEFLFTQKNGKKHTIYSLQHIFKEVQQKAGFDKNNSLKYLRNSFLIHNEKIIFS